MNAIEIERKFLMFDLPKESKTLSIVDEYWIHQFYTSGGYRYRCEIRSNHCLKVNKPYYPRNRNYFYCRIRKVSMGVGVNQELDITEVDQAEFDLKMSKTAPFVAKKRIVFKNEGCDLKFEIDDFFPLKLVMMEIELPELNHQFEMPIDIQPHIWCEVTGKKEFSNKFIAEKISNATTEFVD